MHCYDDTGDLRNNAVLITLKYAVLITLKYAVLITLKNAVLITINTTTGTLNYDVSHN